VNANQAERDRLVRFGEDSVPQLLPADAFCAMPMSWTIVRHYVSQCFACGRRPDRHPNKGVELLRTPKFGKRRVQSLACSWRSIPYHSWAGG
jgi:hypothetical protein